MTLWVAFALMAGCTSVWLVAPLLRRVGLPLSRREHGLAIYRDQLAELEREEAGGILAKDQAEAACIEVQRRILTLESLSEAGARPTARSFNRIIAAILGLAIPLGALAVYGLIGAPSLPGQPYAARQADPAIRMTAMAAELTAQLRASPDPEGYVSLAETYTGLHQFALAAGAYRRAIALGAAGPSLWAALGEAVALSNDGMVGPEARADFENALSQDAREPRARFYLGLAAGQLGKYGDAVAIWRDLEAGSPPGAPWLPMLRQHIDRYARLGGLDPASVTPAPPAIVRAEPPTPEMGVSTLMDQGQAEQTRTIRDMVAGLAARLKLDPNDEQGWLMLSRSYRVLGDFAQARDAAEHAIQLAPNAVEPRLSLAQNQLAAARTERLPTDFVATLRQVLDMDPANPTALYYLGRAEAEAGNGDAARRLWTKLLAALPADAPQRLELARKLDALPRVQPASGPAKE